MAKWTLLKLLWNDSPHIIAVPTSEGRRLWSSLERMSSSSLFFQKFCWKVHLWEHSKWWIKSVWGSYVCKAGLGDVMLGAAATIADYNGVAKASHIKEPRDETRCAFDCFWDLATDLKIYLKWKEVLILQRRDYQFALLNGTSTMSYDEGRHVETWYTSKMIGTNWHCFSKDKLVEIAYLNENIAGTAMASSYGGKATPSGNFLPDVMTHGHMW